MRHISATDESDPWGLGTSGLTSVEAAPPELLAFTRVAARTDHPVLLLGESGSGKSYLARRIHELGPRARGPFVRISCACIPEALFEREMFGHVRGAFTDAKESREGIFEAASRGTLFLDELGEMPLAIQAKLLTVLEEGRVRRLGSPREVPVDVRVIAATNCDLQGMVRQRRFREDLFFRCAVLEYRLPPLRERRDELPSLIRALLERLTPPGESLPTVTPAAIRLLSSYAWPGNIRELENALRRAAAMAEDGCIGREHLPDHLHRRVLRLSREDDDAGPGARYHAPASPAEELEAIRAALRAEDGNRTRAALRLGMSRSTLWTKLRYYSPRLDAGD